MISGATKLIHQLYMAKYLIFREENQIMEWREV